MGRRLVLWIFLIGATIVVVTRFATLRAVWVSLARADVGWLAIAVVLHAAYLALYAELYRIAFAVVGVRSRVTHLLPVYLASTVANAVAPSGGAAGAALFVADANRRGESGARAAIGTLVVLAADLASLAPFLAWSIVVLRSRHELRGWLALGAVPFAAVIVLLLASLAVARRYQTALARPLEQLERGVERLRERIRLRRWSIERGWGARTAAQLADASAAAASRPGGAAAAFALGLLLHVVNGASLAALFAAFGLPVHPGPLVAGFTMGIVFYVVAIVPQGLAVVEGVMALVFTSLGLDPPRVAAAVVAFRTLNVILPVLLGLAFVQRFAAPARERPQQA